MIKQCRRIHYAPIFKNFSLLFIQGLYYLARQNLFFNYFPKPFIEKSIFKATNIINCENNNIFGKVYVRILMEVHLRL